MHDSERLMIAMGDIGEKKIEETAVALGLERDGRQRAPCRVHSGKLLLIAAVVAMLLALGVNAYAANRWGLRELFANPNRGELPEQAAGIVVAQETAVTGTGWTARAGESYCDGDTVLVTVTVKGEEGTIVAPTDEDPGSPPVGDWPRGGGNPGRLCPRARENAAVRGRSDGLDTTGTAHQRAAF